METRMSVTKKEESLQLKNAIKKLRPELEHMPLMTEVLNKLVSDDVFKMELHEKLVRTERYEGAIAHNRELLGYVMKDNHEIKFIEILESIPDFSHAAKGIREQVRISEDVNQEENGAEGEDIADGCNGNGDISINITRKRQWSGDVKEIQCHPQHYTGIQKSDKAHCRYLSFWAEEKSGEIQKVVAVEKIGSEEYLEQLDAVIAECIHTSSGLSINQYDVRKSDPTLPSTVYICKNSKLAEIRRMAFRRTLLNFTALQIINWPLYGIYGFGKKRRRRTPTISETGSNVKILDIVNKAGGERIDTLATIRNVKKSSANIDLNGNEVKRQDVLIGDSTGLIKLVIFGEHVDQLEEGKTYTFEHLRLYGSKPEQRHLKTAKGKTVIQPRHVKIPLPDITDSGAEKLMKATEVCGSVKKVKRVYIYPQCPDDMFELLKPDSAPQFGRCPKCKAMFPLDEVENGVVTNIILKGDDDNLYDIALFKDNIEKIAQLLKKQTFLDDMTNKEKIMEETQIMLLKNRQRFVMETRDSPKGGLVVDGNQISLDMGDEMVAELETALRNCSL